MKPRERLETVLHGGIGDHIPFTIYENKLPQCNAERLLRNQGLCIVQRNIPVVKTHLPDVKITTSIYNENGKTMRRTDYNTPVGNLYSITELAGFTTWHHKKLFSNADDYKPLKFLIDNTRFEPNYKAFLKAQEIDGGDSFFRGSVGSEPLQDLILNYMGTQMFCEEWFDHRDEIDKLYNALVEQRRRVYPLLADSPALAFNYGGNVTPEILGIERFEKYYIPNYNEAAGYLHKKGKLLGVHFDANCKLISKVIAASQLDYIEAFTPAPDTDMTLADAREVWPDKILWINFPSSVHLESIDTIQKTTKNLLSQAISRERFIMGITEDIPQDRWQENLLAIAEVLSKKIN